MHNTILAARAPRVADGALAVQFIQPPVQLLALGRSHGDRLRRSGQALPELIQESQPFFEAETCNIDRGHAPSIPHLSCLRRGRRVEESSDPVIG